MKMLLFRSESCKDYTEEYLNKRKEELRRKKIKFFFRYYYEYNSNDQSKVEKHLFYQMFRPNYVSIKFSVDGYNKYYEKCTFKQDILKDKYQQLIMDKKGKLSKPERRTLLNNTSE